MNRAPLRLLCITAHPDDEAGSFGGALLEAAARGIETHVICMTQGTAATHRGSAQSNEELATIRRREFATSCKLLKIIHGEVLTYPDGTLDRINFHEAVADLTRRIRQVCPQVVMTLGLEGAVTAHADHTMVALFATAAFHWAGRTNRFPEQLERDGLKPHRAQKLYYATASFTLPERQPVSLAPATTILNIAQYVEKKIAAFKSHASQAPLFPIFEDMMRRRGSEERFHLAAATTPRLATMETDLFTGLS